jgi:hypothetical protein
MEIRYTQQFVNTSAPVSQVPCEEQHGHQSCGTLAYRVRGGFRFGFRFGGDTR